MVTSYNSKLGDSIFHGNRHVSKSLFPYLKSIKVSLQTKPYRLNGIYNPFTRKVTAETDTSTAMQPKKRDVVTAFPLYPANSRCSKHIN